MRINILSTLFLLASLNLAAQGDINQTAEGYFNSAHTKQGLEDNRGAIQDYNKAIELNPDYADAYNNRGLAKYKLGDKDGSCLDWSKAGELGNEKAYDLIKEYCQ